ncbi:hypothetical protein HanIR_Chr13g0665271 [Helianthus annuus]|nr:hypothetical protein HanIR_Chr13g0665271 [Helianthus annuus]
MIHEQHSKGSLLMHLLIVTRENFQRSYNVKNEPSPATSKGEFVDTLLCGCGSDRFDSFRDRRCDIPPSCDPEIDIRMTKKRARHD